MKKWFAVAFWCQQAAEKALKAAFIEKKKESPGTTHSLTFLGRELNIPTELWNSLRDLTKEYSKKYKIQKMLLFGSRARGDYKLTSDVDLIVISKDFKKLSFRERPNDFLDTWILPIDFEVICYTPEEFLRKKKEYGIVKQAAKEGQKI